MLFLVSLQRPCLEKIEMMEPPDVVFPDPFPRKLTILVDCIDKELVQFLFWDNVHTFFEGFGIHFHIQTIEKWDGVDSDFIDCRNWCFEIPEMISMLMDVKGVS
jgi:hypothetical protein